ncbi:unnamed protein product [Pichia kudriavzevii]
MVEVYTATYSHIDVYESTIDGIQLMRRCDDNWVNATQILKIAGFGKTQRTRLLEREVHNLVHRKVQGGHGKFQGTWIPLDLAIQLATRHEIPSEKLNVLFYNPETDPPLPKKPPSSSTRSANNTPSGNEKKRLLKIDPKTPTNDRKLSSPQKHKKSLLNTSESQMTSLDMPPTFGMFDGSKRHQSQPQPRQLHAKSKSASNLPLQNSQLITPKSNNRLMVSSNPNSAMNSSYYEPSVQYHQIQAQRELQMLQQQQHGKQQMNPSQNFEVRQPAAHPLIPKSASHSNHQPFYENPNHTISSMTDDQFQGFQSMTESSISSNSFALQDPHKSSHNLHLRYQEYSQSPRYDGLNPNVQNIFQTPRQTFKHQRHHSSPQIVQPGINQLSVSQPSLSAPPNVQLQQQNQILHPHHVNDDPFTDEFDENQEYYTSSLLAFFINDAPVPDFLYNPPADFDIDRSIDDEGHTPLHWAAALAAVDVIQLLVQNNANTLRLNNAGMNPLSKLVHFNNSYDWKNFHVILPWLKNCLAVPDSNQRTPLHYVVSLSGVSNKENACHYYFDEIIKFMYQQQRKAEKFNNENQNSRNLVQLLVNHPDTNGDTALDLALKINSKDFVTNMWNVSNVEFTQSTSIMLQDTDDKENTFTQIPSNEIEHSHLNEQVNTSTPQKPDNKNILPKISPKVVVKKEADDGSLLVIEPSRISMPEINNFVKSLPSMVLELKNTLDNKIDHVNYNVETINKLDSQINSLSHKNAKLLKKISKAVNHDSSVDFTKLSSSDNDAIENFVNSKLVQLEFSLNEKSEKLTNYAERLQALVVANLVKHEEEIIKENFSRGAQSTNELVVSALKLSLLQIKRRKMINLMLQFFLDYENGDVQLNKNIDNSIFVDQKVDTTLITESKIPIFKKLISTLCRLSTSDINTDFLCDIEKMLT